MSDYCHETALRYPISCDDADRIDSMRNYMGYKEITGVSYFTLTGTDAGMYLDYVIYHSYGDECGEWTKVRNLYESEKLEFKHLFEQFFPDINMNKVNMVDYCWYNCCEPPDCYDVTNDPFYAPVHLPKARIFSKQLDDSKYGNFCSVCAQEVSTDIDYSNLAKYCPVCGSPIEFQVLGIDLSST